MTYQIQEISLYIIKPVVMIEDHYPDGDWHGCGSILYPFIIFIYEMKLIFYPFPDHLLQFHDGCITIRLYGTYENTIKFIYELSYEKNIQLVEPP